MLTIDLLFIGLNYKQRFVTSLAKNYLTPSSLVVSQCAYFMGVKLFTIFIIVHCGMALISKGTCCVQNTSSRGEW
jgi:hypothetical protein